MQTSEDYNITVPGASQAWHWAYFSCNGFADMADAPSTGIRPMWSDLMKQHSA